MQTLNTPPKKDPHFAIEKFWAMKLSFSLFKKCKPKTENNLTTTWKIVNNHCISCRQINWLHCSQFSSHYQNFWMTWTTWNKRIESIFQPIMYSDFEKKSTNLFTTKLVTKKKKKSTFHVHCRILIMPTTWHDAPLFHPTSWCNEIAIFTSQWLWHFSTKIVFLKKKNENNPTMMSFLLEIVLYWAILFQVQDEITTKLKWWYCSCKMYKEDVRLFFNSTLGYPWTNFGGTSSS